MDLFYESSLAHHGVKGQKWGVRRYQNKDGTLTEKGKKRYGTVENYEAVKANRRDTARKVGKVAAAVGGVAAAGTAVAVGSRNTLGRKYVNKDGSLTEEGKRRYDQDVRDNNAKKKDSRIVIDGPDPDRWAKEDASRSKKLIDASNDLVNQAKKIERETTPTVKRKPRMDLSKMSDQDLQKAINREQLERRYNDLFNEAEAPKVSAGRQAARTALDVAGGVLATTSSALGIALAIRDLKKKGGK